MQNNKLTQTAWFKARHIYYLTVSVNHKSSMADWVFCSGKGLSENVGPSEFLSGDSVEKKNPFSSSFCCQNSVFCGCGAEVPVALPAGSWRLLSAITGHLRSLSCVPSSQQWFSKSSSRGKTHTSYLQIPFGTNTLISSNQIVCLSDISDDWYVTQVIREYLFNEKLKTERKACPCKELMLLGQAHWLSLF